LILLYEFSIFISKMVENNRKKKELDESSEKTD